MREPSPDLSLDNDWIQNTTYVVNGCVAFNPNPTRLGVDLNCGNIADKAERDC